MKSGSSRESTIVLLYLIIVGMRLFFNDSFPRLWGATDAKSASRDKSAPIDVQTAFKHLVILLLVLAILTAMADSPAYPLAIGIETIAIIYMLLLNSGNLTGKVNGLTAFLGGK